MKASQIFSLLVCLAFVFPASNSYIDNEEQRFIDYLSNRGPKRGELYHEEETDEPERMTFARQRGVHNEKDDQKYHLIKKSATAIIQRMLMDSPPNLDVLLDKAVYFVMKNTMVHEYAQIKSGIKEQVDEVLTKLHNEGEELENPRSKSSKPSTSLREEKIVIAMEEILKELAIRLNLTTPQIKKVVVISVKILAKRFGLNLSQTKNLHERVTSQLRTMLDIEDEDNNDARLRKLEERIEKDIEKYKFSAQQVKRVEELMVEEEAVEENLTNDEKQRMLKRVYADVIDDLRAQKKEQTFKPPSLSYYSLIAINGLIRQKALELQMSRQELKVLGLAILTAVENLSRNVKPTQEAHNEIIPTNWKTKSPSTMKTAEQITMTTKPFTKKGTVKVEEGSMDEPEENRGLKKNISSINHHNVSTTPGPETLKRTPTAYFGIRETKPEPSGWTYTHARESEPGESQRSLVKEETDLDDALARDKAELEEKDMEQEVKAEELELLLERKAQDIEKLKSTTEPTPNLSMPTKDQVTKSSSRSTKIRDTITLTTKPTKQRHVTSRITHGVTHGVTQANEKATEKEKPKTNLVTATVHRKENSEEDLLEERVTEPPKRYVTLQKNQVTYVTQPKRYATEVTQAEHVTARISEGVGKELQHIYKKKQLHSRKNHELLQDEADMENRGSHKIEKLKDKTLETDGLERTENHFNQKKKKTTLEEDLNELLKTKNQELNQLEAELEDLRD